MLSRNFATLAFDFLVKFFILKHSKEEVCELLCVSAAIIAYPMCIFYQNGRRCALTATVLSRDPPVPVAKVPPLPPIFNTATSCGRSWIDGRLPGPSDVPPSPSPSSDPGNEIGFKIWEGGLRLSVVGYRV
jgi:hypothetical protein